MTHNISQISGNQIPENFLEDDSLVVTATASPPRADSPVVHLDPEQVALQNRKRFESAISLLDAFLPSQGGINPRAEALCVADPAAYEKFSTLLQYLFSDAAQKQCIKMLMSNQVLNIKSFEIFGCDHRDLSEADKSTLSRYLAPPSTRAGHCLTILNQIVNCINDINLERVMRLLSRDFFTDEADFERHVLKFEREGERLTLKQKFKAYSYVLEKIGRVSGENFSIPDIRRLTFDSYFSLSTVPPELWRLTQLTRLDLSGGALTSLSAEVAALEQLTSLNLSDNTLTSIPVDIARLTKLADLSIEINRLVDFPVQICELTNLNTLKCGGNSFKSLPAEFGNLVNLETLILYNNQLTTLPAELKTLTRLTTLNAYPSQMSVMPEVMVHFRNLQILHLYFPEFQRPFTDQVRDWLSHLLSQGCDLGGHEPV